MIMLYLNLIFLVKLKDVNHSRDKDKTSCSTKNLFEMKNKKQLYALIAITSMLIISVVLNKDIKMARRPLFCSFFILVT